MSPPPPHARLPFLERLTFAVLLFGLIYVLAAPRTTTLTLRLDFPPTRPREVPVIAIPAAAEAETAGAPNLLFPAPPASPHFTTTPL